MASLNHTRFGISIPFVYDVRTHDVHHRKPRSNYCQFVPWFDMLYGSYEEYKTKEEARLERLAAKEARKNGKKTTSLLDEVLRLTRVSKRPQKLVHSLDAQKQIRNGLLVYCLLFYCSTVF